VLTTFIAKAIMFINIMEKMNMKVLDYLGLFVLAIFTAIGFILGWLAK
jgi:hypothetical protein